MLCHFCGRSVGSAVWGQARWVRAFGVTGNVPACKACAGKERGHEYAEVHTAGHRHWARCPNPACRGVVWMTGCCVLVSTCVHCGTRVRDDWALEGDNGQPDPTSLKVLGNKLTPGVSKILTRSEKAAGKQLPAEAKEKPVDYTGWKHYALPSNSPANAKTRYFTDFGEFSKAAKEQYAAAPAGTVEAIKKALNKPGDLLNTGTFAEPNWQQPPAPKLPLPITPGRYRTRDGRVAEIFSCFPDTSGLALGSMEGKRLAWRVEDGLVLREFSNSVDLVERLPDEPEKSAGRSPTITHGSSFTEFLCDEAGDRRVGDLWYNPHDGRVFVKTSEGNPGNWQEASCWTEAWTATKNP